MQSADALRHLYAVDAIYEFPFTRPGLPDRLEGRAEIVDRIKAGWETNPLKYERYRTLAIYETDDPETIIVEQDALGTSPSASSFALPNLMILTARQGQVTRLRDYVNIPAAAEALGIPL